MKSNNNGRINVRASATWSAYFRWHYVSVRKWLFVLPVSRERWKPSDCLFSVTISIHLLLSFCFKKFMLFRFCQQLVDRGHIRRFNMNPIHFFGYIQRSMISALCTTCYCVHQFSYKNKLFVYVYFCNTVLLHSVFLFTLTLPLLLLLPSICPFRPRFCHISTRRSTVN